MARARAEGVPKAWIEALGKHDIRYRVVDGEIFIDGRDWRRYNRLCDEGKLPRDLC